MTRRKSHPHPRHHDRAQCARADSRPRPRRAEGRDRLRRQCALLGDLRLRPRSPTRISPRPSRRCRAPGLIGWAMDYRVDRARKDVTVTLFGLGRSHAVYRGEARLLSSIMAMPSPTSRCRRRCEKPPTTLLPDIAGPSIVAPQSAAARRRARSRLRRTRQRRRFKRTRAIVVVKDGRVIAERYADGIGIDTPLLGFSSTKSVISALTGILVRQGRAEARRARAGCGVAERRTIRATRSPSIICCATPPGLRSAVRLQASLGAALRAGQPDEIHGDRHGGLAESMPLETPPGSAWNYHDGNYRHSLAC